MSFKFDDLPDEAQAVGAQIPEEYRNAFIQALASTFAGIAALRDLGIPVAGVLQLTCSQMAHLFDEEIHLAQVDPEDFPVQFSAPADATKH